MGTNNADMDAAATEFEEPVGGETDSGLDENLAGALSYLFGVLTGVVFFVIEKDNQFVRFHAAQSIAVFGIVFAASMVLAIVGGVMTSLFLTGVPGAFALWSIVSLVLGLVWMALGFASLVMWVFLMVRAYQGRTPRIPIAASIADRMI